MSTRKSGGDDCRISLDHTAIGILMVQLLYNGQGEPADYLFLDVNAAYVEFCGFTKEEILGKKATELLFHREPGWLAKYGETVKTGKTERFEMFSQALGRWFDVIAIPLADQDALAILLTDISKPKGLENIPRQTNERKAFFAKLVRETARRAWAPAEQARAQASLRESEAKYRKLFETANDGFWWGDKDGYVTEANEGIAKMLGYRQEELIGRFWADFVAEEWLDQGYEAWNICRSGRSGRYQIKLKKKDGSDLWAAIGGTPVLDGENEYAGTLVAFNDITEQKLAQEELRRSEQKARALVKELEEADRNKNQFLSVLSHELRNPLAAISVGIQVLGIEQDPGQIAKTYEIIHRQTDQLCGLMDDLLELTRINQNKIRLKKETIDLNEIVRCAVEDIRLEYQQKGVRLEAEIQAKQIRLYADPARVTQAVGTLLQNALKFTPKGSSVLVTLRRENDDAVIVIRDDGIGIAPETLPNLFSPFTQAYGWEDRSYGGLGLGLSIVKGIVELHGGAVSAYSEGLRKGAAFTVTLPVTTEGSLALERGTAAQSDKKGLKTLIVDDNRWIWASYNAPLRVSLNRGNSHMGQRRIVITDNSKDFVDLLVRFFSKQPDVEIVGVAHDGKQTMQVIERTKPDVLLLDIIMPHKDGLEVLREIKEKRMNVRVLVISAVENEAVNEAALKLGAQRCFVKPVNLTEILDIIRKEAN